MNYTENKIETLNICVCLLKINHTGNIAWLIDLIGLLTSCQLIGCYFIPRGLAITFIVHSYSYFLWRCFLRFFSYCYMIPHILIKYGGALVVKRLQPQSMCCYIHAIMFTFKLEPLVAQSAEATEDTDCISAER